MNNLRRKFTTFILLMGLGIGTAAYGGVLYEEKTEQTITKGAVLIQDKVLMSGGWRNINIIKVNLDEPNVTLKPLESASGTERQTVLQMASDSGAVAGVNADYFDLSTSYTPSFGILIGDGILRHAYNSNYSTLGMNKNMATLLIDNSNTASMEYYGVSMRITSNGTLIGAAATVNNIPSTLTRPVILDRTYYTTTNTAISRLKDTYTIVVQDGVVTQRTKQDEVVTIPQNGFAILLPASIANEYYSKLPLGCSVELSEYLYLQSGVTKAIEDMKLGIGGSGLIMKDGQPYTGAAHKVSPNVKEPRTLVATLKNSNEILLITIDGRTTYNGMTHNEILDFLKGYNIKDAMYLDGGGSTTLVSRAAGETALKVINTPSGGSQRKVVNGIGVYTTNQTGTLNKIYLDSTYDRTFVGEKISFSVKGVDENENPVTVDKTSAVLSISGISGTFNGYTFIPTSSGEGIVTIECNGVYATKSIYVSEKPVGIRVEPSNMQIAVSSSKNIQVYGIDASGYKLPIDAGNVTWTSSSANVKVNASTVTSGGKALARVTADYKGLKGTLGVIVGDTVVPVDSFETNGATWGGDTSSVTGKVENSTAEKYHGNNALKMAYTFMPSANKQVAYTVFKTPISISEDAMSINLWVNARGQCHAAKLEIVDAAGQKYYLKLTDSLNFTGWKYLSASIPSSVKLPAKVTKFYTYASSVSEKTQTAVYIDHLSITRGFREKLGYTVRNDYAFDPYYKESLQAPTSTQYLINVVGTTSVKSMTLTDSIKKNMASQLSKNASVVLQASSTNTNLGLTPTTYTYNNKYQSEQYNNTKILMIGTDSGGIRTTDANAWINLRKAIEGTSAKNVIIVMSKNPLTQFTDSLEGQALHKYLISQNSKNIFVITTGGTENEVRIEDGIRYIKVSGINTVTDNINEGSFLKLKVDGDNVYYTFEKFQS